MFFEQPFNQTPHTSSCTFLLLPVNRPVFTEQICKLLRDCDQLFMFVEIIDKLTQSYGITPSMSSKGNPYDNAMAENFFSILKTECIYRHKPKTLHEANELIDRYIHFYNHERIQSKTGVAPLTLRHSA